MNSTKGIIVYIFLLIFIALIFFPEKQFSASIYGLIHSFSKFINSLTQPNDAAFLKLVFVCVAFLLVAKILAQTKG